METAHLVDLALERFAQGMGQGNGPILLAFAIANDDLVPGQINVFDPEPKAFHESQA
jgi:hypothetical protein